MRLIHKYSNAFLLCFASFAWPLSVMAQNAKIDSLNEVLKIVREDTSKVKTLNNLSLQYINKTNYEKALGYAEMALALAKKINSTAEKKVAKVAKKNMAIALNHLGSIYKNTGNYKGALEKYFAALLIKEELGYQKGIASSHNAIGVVYEFQGEFTKAHEEYLRSLKVYEKIQQPDGKFGDKKGIANSHNNIGNVYFSI